jgi:hypothetical protein
MKRKLDDIKKLAQSDEIPSSEHPDNDQFECRHKRSKICFPTASCILTDDHLKDVRLLILNNLFNMTGNQNVISLKLTCKILHNDCDKFLYMKKYEEILRVYPKHELPKLPPYPVYNPDDNVPYNFDLFKNHYIHFVNCIIKCLPNVEVSYDNLETYTCEKFTNMLKESPEFPLVIKTRYSERPERGRNKLLIRVRDGMLCRGLRRSDNLPPDVYFPRGTNLGKMSEVYIPSIFYPDGIIRTYPLKDFHY